MARKTDRVSEIDDSKETWRLAVRIIDLWSVVNSKGVEHLEMVVMDSKVRWVLYVPFISYIFKGYVYFILNVV